jgi:NAD(P)-dependent dehydrogenase (short-subunit alcohol dehydrogenase family)
MRIADSVAFVTGANRGIGRGFVEALLERGVARVYASARRLETLDRIAALAPEQVVCLQLDVTRPEDVAAAASRCTDVTLLVNNAGVAAMTRLIGAPDLSGARREMETNFWGVLAMCRAFAPVLGANGGGGILNVLSVGAMACFPQVGTYCASKHAAAALTQGVRLELHGQQTHVAGVYTGAVATDMSARTPGPKITPLEHARACLDGFEGGATEIHPDFRSRELRDAIGCDREAFERSLLSRLQ